MDSDRTVTDLLSTFRRVSGFNAPTSNKQVAARKPIKKSMKRPFVPGDEVYARWFGDDTLTIVDKADVASPFPHYICKINRATWIIPKIHLSRKKIASETGDGNRRQLSAFN